MNLKRVLIFVALAILIIIFHILTDGSFTSERNLSNLLRQVAVNAILASGMTCVILLGGIDLGIGSVLALTGVIAGLTQVNLGWGAEGIAGTLGSIGLALLTSLVIGLFNGFFIGHLKIPAFIITLGMMVIARGCALILTGGQAVSPLGEHIAWMGGGYVSHATSYILIATTAITLIILGLKKEVDFSSRLKQPLNIWRSTQWFALIAFVFSLLAYIFSYNGVPIPVLIMGLVFTGTLILLEQTRIGRYIYAIGGNAEAARLAGVPVKKVICGVYVFMSLLAGIASIISIGRLDSAGPTEGNLMELDAIAAVVIGGTSLMGGAGSLWGSLFGALIIGIMNNGMSLMNVPTFYQMVFKGVMIILAVYIDRRTSQ